MTFLRRIFLVAVGLMYFGQGLSIAEDRPDPAKICKETPKDERCIGYLGAAAGFKSLSGNVGNVQTSVGARTSSGYIIFLHSGGTSSRPAAEKLGKLLQSKGYVVRGIDDNKDNAGPGVDYFNAQDKSGAADVAEIANKDLPPGTTPLPPRFQPKVSNPAGFLGIWLPAK